MIVAGAGVAGLLLASRLSADHSLVLLERQKVVPRNKYWLTSAGSVEATPDLSGSVAVEYDRFDFVASDGSRACVAGRYPVWDTDRLIATLMETVRANGAEVLPGHRLYAVRQERDSVRIRAEGREIQARLLIDCMGYASPIVQTSGAVRIDGYYILHGREVGLRGDTPPIALDNVILSGSPTYFELFPTERGTAHATVIRPSRRHRPGVSLSADFNYIVRRSHYAEVVDDTDGEARSYGGIIPVGRLRTPALDRIVFYGEAGQCNPAASATGLTRMLLTYREFARAVSSALRTDQLSRRQLIRRMPNAMSPFNRAFQLALFRSLLDYDSNDFSRFVVELSRAPSDLINDLIFADYQMSLHPARIEALARLLRPDTILGRHAVRAILNRALRR